MKKYNHIYAIWTSTSYGTGVQPVKGDTEEQAQERFKKRFPKKPILDCHESDSHNFISKPI